MMSVSPPGSALTAPLPGQTGWTYPQTHPPTHPPPCCALTVYMHSRRRKLTTSSSTSKCGRPSIPSSSPMMSFFTILRCTEGSSAKLSSVARAMKRKRSWLTTTDSSRNSLQKTKTAAVSDWLGAEYRDLTQRTQGMVLAETHAQQVHLPGKQHDKWTEINSSRLHYLPLVQ